MRKAGAGWLLVLLCLILSGRAAAADPPDTRPVVLLVISPVAYHEGELETVRSVLAAGRVRLLLASTRRGLARGMGRGSASVDMTLEQVEAERIDALVILGGTGAKTYLWFNPTLRALVQKLNLRNCPIGALSIAPGVLVHAGVLDGRRAAALPSPELRTLFGRHRVTLLTQEVAVDGNLVTGASTSAAPAFASALLDLLPQKRGITGRQGSKRRAPTGQ
jgi:protease I